MKVMALVKEWLIFKYHILKNTTKTAKNRNGGQPVTAIHQSINDPACKKQDEMLYI